MIYVITIFVISLVLYAFSYLLNSIKSIITDNFKDEYELKETLTKQEELFYIHLHNALPVEYSILSRTKISELVGFSKKLSNNNKLNIKNISQLQDYSVDFVILDENLSFCCAIDLNYKDKPLHIKNINIEKDELFEDIDIALFKYNEQPSYDFENLITLLKFIKKDNN